MRRQWRSAARSFASQDTPARTVVGTLMKQELVGRLPWIIGGWLFSFPATVAAGYLVSFVAQDYIQAFWLSYIPALAGLGLIGLQIVLIHEGIHHTIYRTNEWVSKMRKWFSLLSFVITAYFLLFFLPVENPLNIWNHPVLKIMDTILITLLGILSPYLAKIGYDYFPLTPEGERSIWKASFILVGMYYLIGAAAVFLFFPRTSLFDLGVRFGLITISLLGVLYAVKWNLREQRKGVSLRDYSEVREPDHVYFTIIRDSKILTFIAATLAGAWLPILAGVSTSIGAGLSASPLGVAPGIFIIGYPKLFLFGWVMIFGPLILSILLSALALTATIVANSMS